MFSDPIAESLYQAVLDSPADDGVRLILADRLEEVGEEDRAEFIRTGIELAEIERGPKRYNWCKNNLTQFQGDCGLCPWCKCRKREGELLGKLKRFDPFWQNEDLRPSDYPVLIFRRGFIAEVNCLVIAWVQYGTNLVRQHPIEVLRFTDRQHYVDDVDLLTASSLQLARKEVEAERKKPIREVVCY